MTWCGGGWCRGGDLAPRLAGGDAVKWIRRAVRASLHPDHDRDPGSEAQYRRTNDTVNAGTAGSIGVLSIAMAILPSKEGGHADSLRVLGPDDPLVHPECSLGAWRRPGSPPSPRLLLGWQAHGTLTGAFVALAFHPPLGARDPPGVIPPARRPPDFLKPDLGYERRGCPRRAAIDNRRSTLDRPHRTATGQLLRNCRARFSVPSALQTLTMVETHHNQRKHRRGRRFRSKR